MILVTVRRDDTEQPVPPLHDKGGVGHDHIDPGLVLFLAESDAAIDDQPLPVMAVEVEVHPDLAAAAEREEIQRVGIALGKALLQLRRYEIHRWLLSR